MILGRYTKQPTEVEDYDIDFSDWLRAGETLATSTATVVCQSTPGDSALASSGVTIASSSVRVRLTGGTAGETYKVTVSTTSGGTGAGRLDESEFIVKVKDY